MTPKQVESLIKAEYPSIESRPDDLHFCETLTGYNKDYIFLLVQTLEIPQELSIENIVLTILDHIIYTSGYYGMVDDAFGL